MDEKIEIETPNEEASKEEQKKVPKKEHHDKQKKELEAKVEELQATQEKVLRISAEMQNMRRRYEEEIARICKYEGEETMKKILPIVDNFERAIKLDDNDLTDELSKFLSGFKMIYTNLVNILNESEVKEIICLNEEFDPSKMEAVLTEKVEGIEKNKVIEVFQKGYMYKDKVIRPAMVKVNN